VASEPLESASKAPAAEVASSSCLRRAAARSGEFGATTSAGRAKKDWGSAGKVLVAMGVNKD